MSIYIEHRRKKHLQCAQCAEYWSKRKRRLQLQCTKKQSICMSGSRKLFWNKFHVIGPVTPGPIMATVTTIQVQKTIGQEHLRQKIDLGAWQRGIGSGGFSSYPLQAVCLLLCRHYPIHCHFLGLRDVSNKDFTCSVVCQRKRKRAVSKWTCDERSFVYLLPWQP